MSKKRRESAPIFSAAGLVRYYEESDVGIKLSPHILIAIMVGFAAIVIIASKLFPPGF